MPVPLPITLVESKNVKKSYRLKKVLDASHMLLHICIGLLISQTASILHPGFDMKYFLLPAIIGSLFPDLDHILYFFTYGRDASYSKIVRQLLKSGNIVGVIRYCAVHHKELTGLYSHNLFSIITCFILGLILFSLHYWWWGVLSVSIVAHLSSTRITTH